MVKNWPLPPGDLGSIPGNIPQSRKWQPTSVFLARKICEQRSLTGPTVHGVTELDTAEHTTHTASSTVLILAF